MANLAELSCYLSGGSVGAGNNTPTISLGGVLSSTKVVSQSATVSGSSIPGVTLGDAQGNAIGTGTLNYTYDVSSPSLRWTPPNGSIGPATIVSANGTYALAGGSSGGVLIVTIVAASLPGASTSEAIVIDWERLKIFDTITKAQALAGLIEYRCLFLKNTGSVATTDDKVDIELYIETNTPGADVISLALALEGPSTGAGSSGVDYPAIVANEATAPAGVTFTAPTSAAPLPKFNLSSTAGTTYAKAFWIKREVPAGTTTEQIDDYFVLAYNVKV